MLAEWQRRDPGSDIGAYATRETMAGVGGHLWVLGIVQGALLGLIAAVLTATIIGAWTDVRRPAAVNNVS
jgi:hypothetical protein